MYVIKSSDERYIMCDFLPRIWSLKLVDESSLNYISSRLTFELPMCSSIFNLIYYHMVDFRSFFASIDPFVDIRALRGDTK